MEITKLNFSRTLSRKLIIALVIEGRTGINVFAVSTNNELMK